MAKSIYAILNDLETATSVPGFGDEIAHTIPPELFPTDKVFENGDDLLDWAETSGFTHALIQKGLQKAIIEVRATFKSCPKDETWSPEYGQKNVDDMTWDVVNRPNQGGTKAVKQAKLDAGIQMAKAMSAAGLDDEMILASLSPVYGDDGAAVIMESIVD